MDLRSAVGQWRACDQVIGVETLLSQALDYPPKLGNPQVIHTHMKNIRAKMVADGDGKADMLFVDASGNYASWLLGDTAIIGGGGIGNPGAWHGGRLAARALAERGEGVIQLLSHLVVYGDRGLTERVLDVCKGSGVTVTIPVVTDGVTLKDNEAWVEVEYLGTSGLPLGSFASDAAPDVLDSGTNQTTDATSSWTTTGLGSPVKQSLATTFTPQEKGLVRARVCLAKASTV